MARLRVATDANGVKFYPITITKGVYDTEHNQRLSDTLGWFNAGSNVYATCTTASATSSKTATAVDASGWRLRAGAMAIVTFTNGLTLGGETLNIANTGAKSVYFMGAAITADVILSGDTAILIYDGTRYNVMCIDRLMLSSSYATIAEAQSAANELT